MRQAEAAAARAVARTLGAMLVATRCSQNVMNPAA
jgi:hypothetical protein